MSQYVCDNCGEETDAICGPAFHFTSKEITFTIKDTVYIKEEVNQLCGRWLAFDRKKPKKKGNQWSA